MTDLRHPKRTPEITPLLDALERHAVCYVLTGSVAASLYGIDIGQPGDLDITPALDRENLERLAQVLRAVEASIEGSVGEWTETPEGEQKWIEQDLTEAERTQISVAWSPNPDDLHSLDNLFLTRYGNLDVVPEIAGTYAVLKRRASLIPAYGLPLWVAHVDDLLSTLTVPRRKKDAERVRQLRQIQRQAEEKQPGLQGD